MTTRKGIRIARIILDSYDSIEKAREVLAEIEQAFTLVRQEEPHEPGREDPQGSGDP